MTLALDRELPPPSDWQAFERLCFDVYSRAWETNDASMHGRRGQAQSGVDVYGTDRLGGIFTGVQCKGKDGEIGSVLTEDELLAEVEKAKSFEPPLGAFVLATTSADDVKLQAAARRLTVQHAKTGLFSVQVEGWGTLKQRITNSREVLEKHFPDLAPVSVLEKIDESAASIKMETAAQFAAFEHKISGLLAAQVEQRDPNDPLQAKISALSELINQGQAAAALGALRALQEKEQATASPRNLFRMRANIGAALLTLGDYEDAAIAFHAAYDFDREWPGAIAIKATALLLDGDKPNALALARLALEKDPKNNQAASVIIDAAAEDLSAADIEALIPPTVERTLDLLVGFSLRARRSDEGASALSYAERALALDATDWRSTSAVAELLLADIFPTPELPITHSIAPQHKEGFDRATGLLRTAWSAANNKNEGRRAIHVAANLISCLDILGDRDEAEKVLADGLAIAPDDPNLLRRFALSRVVQNDWDGAVGALSAISADEVKDQDKYVLIQAKIHSNQAEAALADAESLLAGSADERTQEIAAAMQIEAAGKLGSAEAAFDRLAERFPNSIMVLSAALAFLPKSAPNRAELLERVERLVVAATDPRDIFHAAQALYYDREFSRAADQYARISCPTKDTEQLRRRLISLHRSNRRKDARELFESLAPEISQTSDFLELGISIYESSGLLPAARQLLEAAIALKPDDLETRLAWIGVSERLADTAAAAKWLMENGNSVEGSAAELMQLALAMHRLAPGPDVLPLAYRALRAGYDDPQIHLSYTMGLFLLGNISRDYLTPPSISGPDAAILLKQKNGDRTLSYVIETADAPRIERGEIAPLNPLAPTLTGLAVGDEVELSNAGPSPTFFEVTELRNKYLHAHFRSLEDFERLFPDNKAMGRFSIDPTVQIEGQFDPIFDSVRQRAAQARELENFYRSGSMPIALFAQLAGVSGFDIWEGIRASPDLVLITCVGTEDELASARLSLATRPSAVVDPITLYGLRRMGIESHVSAAFSEIGVVQSTIDLFREFVKSRSEGLGVGKKQLHAVGDKFAFTETSDDDVRAQIAIAEDLLSYALSLSIYPAEPVREIKPEARQIFAGLPRAYLDTIYSAQGDGRVLLCDDRAMRLLAEEAGGATGLWSQAAVAVGRSSGGITQAQQNEAIVRLIGATSTFTMLPVVVLIETLKENAWSVNDDVKTLIVHGCDPGSDQTSVRNLWADVFLVGFSSGQRFAEFTALAEEVFRTFSERQPKSEKRQFLKDVLSIIRNKMIGARGVDKIALLSTSSNIPVRSLLRLPSGDTNERYGVLKEVLESALSVSESLTGNNH